MNRSSSCHGHCLRNGEKWTPCRRDEQSSEHESHGHIAPQPSQLLILLPLGTGGFMLLLLGSGHPKWVSEAGGEGPSYDAWQLVTRMLVLFVCLFGWVFFFFDKS